MSKNVSKIFKSLLFVTSFGLIFANPKMGANLGHDYFPENCNFSVKEICLEFSLYELILNMRSNKGLKFPKINLNRKTNSRLN